MSKELKAGDKVLIARKVENSPYGWLSRMDREIGKVGEVTDSYIGKYEAYQVRVGSGIAAWYPRDALELQGEEFKVYGDLRNFNAPVAELQVDEYKIDGLREHTFPSIEAAEEFIKASVYHAVSTHVITKVVKRVTVKRETVVTLEAV